ncbi:MAG: 4-hydroxy-tetrahydrodipicolinate reductase [Cryobacterium sp.]|nr:4-hydroxy-tetrahydrodipicolinate reductase [Oligoflexia bacterium]
MTRFKIGVLGIAGKMGAELKTCLEQSPFLERFELVSAPLRGEPLEGLLESDVIVEFSSPDVVLELCRLIQQAKGGRRPALVVGATGWTEAQIQTLSEFAKVLPILRASNFSLGVMVAKLTLELWASFPELKDWKSTIREWHHTRKKDAPSGTALTLRDALRRSEPIESIREGDIVGTHEVSLENEFERLTVIHTAKNRSVFASGALGAALRLMSWLSEESNAELPRRELSLDDLYLRREA